MRRHVAARLLGAQRHYELLERRPDDESGNALHHDLLRARKRVMEAREAALQCDTLTFAEFQAISQAPL